MHRKATIIGVALLFALSVAVIAQTNSFDALVQAVQTLLGDKGAPVPNSFLDTTAPEGKSVEGNVSNAFSELEVETPAPPSDAIESVLQESLSAKTVTVEQGFLLPDKEPGAIGNEFSEEPSE